MSFNKSTFPSCNKQRSRFSAISSLGWQRSSHTDRQNAFVPSPVQLFHKHTEGTMPIRRQPCGRTHTEYWSHVCVRSNAPGENQTCVLGKNLSWKPATKNREDTTMCNTSCVRFQTQKLVSAVRINFDEPILSLREFWPSFHERIWQIVAVLDHNQPVNISHRWNPKVPAVIKRDRLTKEKVKLRKCLKKTSGFWLVEIK